MPAFASRFMFAALLCLLLPALRVLGQEGALTFINSGGATLRFAETADATWTWAGLTTPGTETEWSVTEAQSSVAVNGTEVVLASVWTLAEQTADRLVLEQVAPDANLGLRRIYSFGPAAHIVRVETWVRSLEGTRTLTGLCLLDLHVDINNI